MTAAILVTAVFAREVLRCTGALEGNDAGWRTLFILYPAILTQPLSTLRKKTEAIARGSLKATPAVTAAMMCASCKERCLGCWVTQIGSA